MTKVDHFFLINLFFFIIIPRVNYQCLFCGLYSTIHKVLLNICFETIFAPPALCPGQQPLFGSFHTIKKREHQCEFIYLYFYLFPSLPLFFNVFIYLVYSNNCKQIIVPFSFFRLATKEKTFTIMNRN